MHINGDDYERKKDGASRRQDAETRKFQDIAGDYPCPGNADRREACRNDLGLFLRTYFPRAFNLPWSKDHPRVLASVQAKVTGGGLLALAMPRGHGKTAISLRAALWALLYRHCRFVCLIGPTDKHAQKLLKQLKHELQFNDLLAEDFRQVCYPIRRLENNARRAAGQLFSDQRTLIEWTSVSVSFPVMPDSACDVANVGGSVVTVAGLTGSLRGQSHTLPDGEIIRPELVILDDPQTRKSASSLALTEERVEIVTGDVLGMAGQGRGITVIMPCTVIAQGDLADQMLDRKAHPEWQGERTKAVYSWTTNEALWQEYHDRRGEELRNDGDGSQATEFYREHQAEMDAGAEVAWPEKFDKGEISAVQHAQNALQKLGRYAYFAEYQNDPQAKDEDSGQLVAAELSKRGNGLARGVVPLACTRLTAFVDVQQKVLFWLVAAWKEGMGGAIIDHGTYPDQQRRYFTLSDVQRTLARAAPGAGLEGSIHAGLTKLADQLLTREWKREDGAAMKVERLVVDAGYQGDTVKAWCRKSTHAALVTPSHGKGVGAKGRPFSEYRSGPGDRIGFHWMLTQGTGRNAVRHLLIDTNFFKSLASQRLQTAVGDRGALTFFGTATTDHRLLAAHLTAEKFVTVSANGREVEEWNPPPPGVDNHWWDCLVGSMAAASLQGVTIREAEVKRETKRVRWSEVYEKKHGRAS